MPLLIAMSNVPEERGFAQRLIRNIIRRESESVNLD